LEIKVPDLVPPIMAELPSLADSGGVAVAARPAPLADVEAALATPDAASALCW